MPQALIKTETIWFGGHVYSYTNMKMSEYIDLNKHCLMKTEIDGNSTDLVSETNGAGCFVVFYEGIYYKVNSRINLETHILFCIGKKTCEWSYYCTTKVFNRYVYHFS